MKNLWLVRGTKGEWLGRKKEWELSEEKKTVVEGNQRPLYYQEEGNEKKKIRWLDWRS